nr:uncharacterized protein LOC117688068 [Crassostrea gigas]XP_034321642.1 uncharacterized protein LOC117688068 [Crassostrea gigas]
MSTEVPMSKEAEKLKKQIQSKEKDLHIYKSSIDLNGYESITVLTARKEKKEKDYKNCYWYQALEKRSLASQISRLDKQIDELEHLEELEEEIESLRESFKDHVQGPVWEGYPESLDEKIVRKYTDKFRTLVYPLTPAVQFFNIIMVGESGAGKSSLLKTFTTALSNKEDIADIYRIGPSTHGKKSATLKMHLEPIYIGGETKEQEQCLPCRFYDMPGLDDDQTVTEDEIMKIINNNTNECKDSKEAALKKNLTPADEVHCILYVINAKANLTTTISKSINIMKSILQRIQKDDGIRQFVVVTAIDELGVPNEDMKNAYKYRCVRKHCEKVSVAFNVDLFHVIPVSNYFVEVTSNDAKNAMSLFNFWRVFHSGKDFIDRHWNKKETPEGLRKLMV